MKRIFCDCCGEEMAYGLGLVQGVGHGVELPRFNSTEKIKASVTVGFEFDHKTGEHLDVCSNCRWKVLYKLDLRPRPAAEPNKYFTMIIKMLDIGSGQVLDAIGGYDTPRQLQESDSSYRNRLKKVL